jgi:hypothetical protein
MESPGICLSERPCDHPIAVTASRRPRHLLFASIGTCGNTSGRPHIDGSKFEIGLN